LERIAEAARNIKADIVVNIQGDEPLLFPEMIDLAVKPLVKDKKILCSNLIGSINTREEFKDPNTIKVVIDKKQNALYFSREPIPTDKRGMFGPVFKQVCIMPFKKGFLLKFVKMESTPLEKAESIDMLRILEHGYAVKTVYSDSRTYSVDTPQDLKRVEKVMIKDRLFRFYRCK